MTSGIPGKIRPAKTIGWIVQAPALAIAMTAVLGCTSEEAAQPVGVDEEIFGGVKDEKATSVVALRIKRANNYELCSGTLLSPNVVLTARHCVARILTDSVSCTEDGTSRSGMEHFTEDEPPENIGIFLGTAPSFSKTPVAVGKAIIAPDTKILCNADIAILILDKNIDSAPALPVRLSANARIGESIRAVGYGANDAKTPMGTRFRREQVPVLAVGKGVSKSSTRLGEHEFEVGNSICEGDSGGPAISELTDAVIGVVSRGGDCTDNYGHVYTSTAGFKPLFDRAFAEAGGQPLLEQNTPPENVEADPTETPGAPGGGAGGGNNQAPPQGGCSAAPIASRNGGALLLGVGLGFGLVVARRRKR